MEVFLLQKVVVVSGVALLGESFISDDLKRSPELFNVIANP